MGAGHCQWVDLLTEIYVIYMKTHISQPLGPTVLLVKGQTVQTGELGQTDKRTDAIKYIISLASQSIIIFPIFLYDSVPYGNKFTVISVQCTAATTMKRNRFLSNENTVACNSLDIITLSNCALHPIVILTLLCIGTMTSLSAFLSSQCNSLTGRNTLEIYFGMTSRQSCMLSASDIRF